MRWYEVGNFKKVMLTMMNTFGKVPVFFPRTTQENMEWLEQKLKQKGFVKNKTGTHWVRPNEND